MLTLENVAIRQGDFSLRADFTIQAGQRVAVIGRSGAGKSTLLSLIAGFFPPEEGSVLFDGQNMTKAAPGKRPLAMLFQDNNLFPHLSVAQNVGLGVRPDLRLNQVQKSLVANAIERVGLSGLEDRKPAQLSGGQQSRVALARILVQDKPLVLLDEPFAALGPALKIEMLDLVAEVLEETGAALLMVSHDPQDARRIAPMTVLVADGVAYAPTETGALLDNPPPALKAYLG
ncbi:thiamine transport system ATP-binding protein [Shimia gijangensis]|uniref:Thiamine transport system ATP-binding protein n=1 Tax=Shimia gijangensis TaxID=1470563 RepID=A0A1M6AWF0_9RHOB|nr:thiamine ABC transporter ATP-binding protein [Shimia gijangensis]SHI40770.1 thiamine transport system ATP-binding protein [Shimia gijangensis]